MAWPALSGRGGLMLTAQIAEGPEQWRSLAVATGPRSAQLKGVPQRQALPMPSAAAAGDHCRLQLLSLDKTLTDKTDPATVSTAFFLLTQHWMQEK